MSGIHIDEVERTFKRLLPSASGCFYNVIDKELKEVRALGVCSQCSIIAKLFLDFPDLISSFLNTFDPPTMPESYLHR